MRQSARLAARPRVVYRAPTARAQRRFYVYDIVDRETEEPWRYRVKWLGFKNPGDDTWEYRVALMTDGFDDMLNYVDSFKEWEEDAEEGEVRTFQEFKKEYPASTWCCIVCTCCSMDLNACYCSLSAGTLPTIGTDAM